MWMIYEYQCLLSKSDASETYVYKSSHFYSVTRKTSHCSEKGCCGCEFACVCVSSLITFRAEEDPRRTLIGEQSWCSLCAKSPQSPLCSFSILMTPLHEKLGSSSIRTHTQVRYEWAQPLYGKRIVCCDEVTKAVTMFHMKRQFHYHIL